MEHSIKAHGKAIKEMVKEDMYSKVEQSMKVNSAMIRCMDKEYSHGTQVQPMTASGEVTASTAMER